MVSRCFPGGYNVKLYISRGRLAWWLLAFLCCVTPVNVTWNSRRQKEKTSLQFTGSCLSYPFDKYGNHSICLNSKLYLCSTCIHWVMHTHHEFTTPKLHPCLTYSSVNWWQGIVSPACQLVLYWRQTKKWSKEFLCVSLCVCVCVFVAGEL